jgi:hypothetical protein
MMEINTWIFVAMIAGLIVAGVFIDIQDKKIKQLRKDIKHLEDCSHPG